MPEVVMPRLSDSMEEGTILKWLRADGDEVRRGDELVEIETDKATMTYEADGDGVLEILAAEGATLPIGEVIARIGGGRANGNAPEAPDEAPGPGAPGAADGQAPVAPVAAAPAVGPAPQPVAEPGRGVAEAPPPAETPADGPGPVPAPESAPAAAPVPAGGERLKASPVARRVAREQGVDLATLTGSGPNGRIVKADVEAAARAPTAPATQPAAPAAPPAPAAHPAPPAGDRGPAKGDVEVQELDRTQQTIARRMAEAKATIPEFTLEATIDMEAAVAARAQLKRLAVEDQPVPSYNDMVVRACALALREHPRANGAYRDGRFELHGRVNVGVAVATEDALVVPTVFDADTKSLAAIAAETRVLAERVRSATITPPELSGGTFTVSNLGMFGVRSFTAVINPPHGAG